MSGLKEFEEYIKSGIVSEVSSDVSRARSLIDESSSRKKFLSEMISKIGISEENANYFIENAYDVLISLLRAKLLLNGYKTRGEGAHEAEVSYMKKLGFSENNVRFMDNLRYHRNGIKYYGKRFDSEYAQKVVSFMEKTFSSLTNLIEEFRSI